ncbi:DUF4340 domain-containing protein [Calothrix sp. CCY 0018]|uniref:DUF4340 domain-containing protein n=1 Tax=Calothrix sp. CCY 0018 TaxID=3103864 RepID=UPI0039C5ECE3
MKIQRTTLGLVLIAILLGGFVYFYEFHLKAQQEAVKKKQQQLFSFKEEDVKNLKITTPRESIALERSPESGKTKWLMKSPDNVPANDGTVAYLLSLLETENIERTLSAKPSQVSEFGLKQPQATIDITLNNQTDRKLILGKPTFDNRFLYAQNQFPTKPDGNFEVITVSKKFEDAINRSLSEWKAVDNNQITPSPTPQATPTIPATGATPALPTINPIPINPSPNIPNNSTSTSTPTPNNSTPKPTSIPNNSTSTPTPTPTPTPNNSTPKPTPTLNPPSAPTKD